MSRGQSVVGWWCIFPGAPEEPKKFTSEEDALQFWPEVKSDSVYCPGKYVFRVWWDYAADGAIGFQSRAADGPYTPEEDKKIRNTVKVGLPFVSLTNPLSPDGFVAAKQDLQQQALDKKKAKKNASRDPEFEAKQKKLDDMMAAGQRKREADKARRREFAQKRNA